MSETTLDAPAPGWYADPSSAAAYRWWDGRHWTSATLPERPAEGPESATPHTSGPAAPQPVQQPPVASTATPASPPVAATPGGALPTRRSLRAQAAAASGASPAAAPHAAAPQAAAQPASSAARAAPQAAEPPAGLSGGPFADQAAHALAGPAAQTTTIQPAAASNAPPLSGPPRAEPIVQPPFAGPPTASPITTPAVDPRPAGTPFAPAAAATSHLPQVAAQAAAQPAPALYRPVNPLAAPRAAEVPVSPPGFTVPAAWAANAPVAPPSPGYAVYPGQPGQPVYGAAGLYGSTLPEPKNTPARLALTFALLAVMLSVVSGLIAESGVGGATAAVTFEQFGRLALVGLILATIPLAIVGLVRASGYKRNGFRAKGRPHAIVALILVALWIFLIVAAVAVALHNPALRTQQTSTPAGTSQQAAPAVEPDVALLQGDGTYAYSQAQAQTSIGAAYTQALKAAPTSVVCPATEPMQVSISFACTVTIQGGTVTTAQVTIVDPEGHVEVQVH